MLTLIARKKRRERVDVAGALCKALGWYFPLLAKMGVESVEQLIFAKYPLVCPYCRKSPHVEAECKLIKGTEGILSHDAVRQLTSANWDSRPANLNEWQRMFSSIYPRALNAGSEFSTIALFEEIGELTEAVRVFDRYPHYFYGEAADVFSYIMALANEHSMELEARDEVFDFQAEYLSRFPGLCIACGARVCVCPTLPPATVGRMAKEMPLTATPIIDVEKFDEAGRTIAQQVLENVGRSTGIAKRLPYDRGEMNAGLTQLAFRLGHALEDDDKGTADRLVALAIELGAMKRESGTEHRPLTINVLDLLRTAWLQIDPDVQTAIEEAQPLLGEYTRILDTNVLFVSANSRNDDGRTLRIDRELREIKRRIRQGTHRDRINLEIMTAATPGDLRVELLSKSYDLIHFAGHANDEGIELQDDEGAKVTLEYADLGDMLREQPDLQCLVLNACNAMTGLDEAIAPLVIGMTDEIDDDEAIEFARGFYDALAAGRSPEAAFRIGATGLAASGMDRHIVAKMTQQASTNEVVIVR
jgi:NTP pyrophosphatase (non-canonical NTP hydrolase)